MACRPCVASLKVQRKSDWPGLHPDVLCYDNAGDGYACAYEDENACGGQYLLDPHEGRRRLKARLHLLCILCILKKGVDSLGLCTTQILGDEIDGKTNASIARDAAFRV